MHAAPFTPELGRIRCPALVVVGEKDPLGAGGSVIIHRALAARAGATSRLAILPGLRHAVFREDPDGFNRLLLDFLRSAGGSARP
jgi:pimeloyl-ACP methyl ester carboxylesterase